MLEKDLIRYCCGFLFSKDKKHVALIWKLRPKVFEGLLNGPGGKLHPGETPIQAMIREFLEECGLMIHGWELYCVLNNQIMKGLMYTFRARLTIEGLPELKMLTDEKPEWFLVEDLMKPEMRKKLIPSLYWLLPLALDDEMSYSDVTIK